MLVVVSGVIDVGVAGAADVAVAVLLVVAAAAAVAIPIIATTKQQLYSNRPDSATRWNIQLLEFAQISARVMHRSFLGRQFCASVGLFYGASHQPYKKDATRGSHSNMYGKQHGCKSPRFFLYAS